MYSTKPSDLTFSDKITLNKEKCEISLSNAIPDDSRVYHSQTLESDFDNNVIEYKLLLDLGVFGRDSIQNQRFVELKIILKEFLS